MKQWLLIIIVGLVFGFSACEKDDLNQSEQLVVDIDKIEAYLKANNIEAEKTTSGLYYVVTKIGTGSHPAANSEVKVKYAGKFLDDGAEFDSGTSKFYLTGVIPGWTEGIPKFKKGGKGQLFIPSYLGYGPSGSYSIPSNAVLIFDVELIAIY
ncbi:MAG: FKBP-type peptidyl-prolyl cis-trans isomerase [Bacteroidales bacterium]|nr:FKBP-type peptidyl-prolyl cis-trans isomerase [Bacteroidales bacterium]